MFLFNRYIRIVLLLAVLFSVIGVRSALAHEGRNVGDYNFIVGFINEPAIEGMINGVSLRVASLKEGVDDHHAGTKMSSGIDLVSHGGVFVSELGADAVFEFTFDHDFEDLTVPFHAHPIETQGSIMVGHDNPSGDLTVIKIHSSGFEPAMVMIRPETTIKFENHMGESTVIMSGQLGDIEQNSDEPIHSNAVEGITTLEVEVTHIASGISQVLSLKESFGIPGQYEAGFIPTSPGPYRFRFIGDLKGQTVDEVFESGNTTFDEVKSAKEIQFPVQLSAPRETENAARGALDTANEAREDAAHVAGSASTGILLGTAALILGVVALLLAVMAFQRSGRKA